MSKLDANEPVRRNLYAAAVIVAVATALGILGAADPWTPQVIAMAVSVGLGELAAIAFGVEHARGKVYGPKTVDGIMDAEAVIQAAERDDL